MIAASRRSILTGLVALVAAPAIVRVGSLMPVNSGLVPGNALLTVDQITREAVRLFQNGHTFRALMERQVEINKAWAADDAKIGSQLRIRLPNDFVVIDGPPSVLRYNKERRSIDVVPQIPDSLVLAAAAAAITPVVLAKPVTRRFWGK